MPHWWEHESLTASASDLHMDGVSLRALAAEYNTPLFVYSRATVQRQLRRVQDVLAAAVDRSQIYYAMKANRHPGVLRAVRETPGVGIDACSPAEVALALASGFAQTEISFNAGMLSDRDLARLAQQDVHCTLDSFSALRRYGQVAAPGATVGLRFDPGVVAAYRQNPMAGYGAKFGFDVANGGAALDAAHAAGLRVDTIHMHIGWGIPATAGPLMDAAFGQLAQLAAQMPDLRQINVGGGLGGRFQPEDEPLALEMWAELIRRHFGRLGLTVACEPGTFVAAPAGVLLLEVNTVETRRGIHWLGVDGGFPIAPCPALYDLPLTVAALAQPLAAPVASYHVAGHINEGSDIWARHQPLPAIREGDLLALLPAGAYTSSMASRHCLRGEFSEVMAG
ncbi:MAG: diaminopimelate decarboxylase [Caldilineaceae bacterium]|nr:diaminopimelate decarboxylase [Caldilineaceae bacterium]